MRFESSFFNGKENENTNNGKRSFDEKGTNSPSQSAGWILRAAPVSHQRRSTGQWLPVGGWDTTLSSNGSSHRKAKVRAVGVEVSVHVARGKNGLVPFTAPDYSTTFPPPP